LNVRKDQSFLAAFVKGFPDIAGIAAAALGAFLTAAFENPPLTGSLLAESPRLWPAFPIH
jgi:hypothetical protein